MTGFYKLDDERLGLIAWLSDCELFEERRQVARYTHFRRSGFVATFDSEFWNITGVLRHLVSLDGGSDVPL